MSRTPPIDEIKTIGKARRPEDLPRLARWLQSAADPDARAQAAACLGWQRSSEALAPLVAAAVGDPSSLVRAASLRALASLKDPDAAEVLARGALQDADPLCRSLALRLAGLLGVERDAVAAAIQAASAPPVVLAEACLAAGRLGDPADAPALWRRFELPSSDETVRRSAGMAWCQLASAMNPTHARRLEALLMDSDADLRVAAMGALERLVAPDAARLIAPLRDDPHPAVQRVARAVHARMSHSS